VLLPDRSNVGLGINFKRGLKIDNIYMGSGFFIWDGNFR